MLLGRDAEVARLDELLDGLRSERGGVLALLGEAGIGKSALLDEVVERAGDMTVLRASATDLDQPLAYRALADLIAPLWREIRERTDNESTVLAAALGLGPNSERPSDTAVGMALLDALSRASDARPVLVVLDDVEWVDESSRLAIAFVTRRVAAERIGVVVASRQIAEHVSWLGRLPTLQITAISVANADALAAALVSDGAIVAPGVVARCWEATGGNTLAFAELVRSLDDDERSGRRAPAVDRALVGALGRGFADRLELLSRSTRLALATVALAGDAPLAIVELSLASLQLSAADLRPAQAAGVLIAPTTFAHALLRTAAVAALDPSDLRDVHRALAGAFVGIDDERHTWHLSSATEWTDHAVADALAGLAETYAARGALAEAAQAWRRAAELSPDPHVAAERFVGALQAWWVNGQVVTALDESMSPAFRVNDPAIALPRAVIAGQALAWQGRPREGIELLRRAADEAVDRPAPAAIALSLAASFMALTEGIEAAATLSLVAVERAAASGDAIADMATAAVHGWHELLLGRTDAAVQRLAMLEMMVDSFVPLGGDAAQLVALVAMKRIVTERFDDAQQLLENFIATSTRRGWAAWSVFARSILAAVHLRRGRLTDAFAITSGDPEEITDGGAPLARAWGLGLAAQVTAALGRVGATQAAIADAQACAIELDLPALDAWAAAALGHLELSRANNEAAATALLHADAAFSRYDVIEPGLVWWHGDLVDALVRCGRAREAGEVLDRLEGLSRGIGGTWARAVVLRGRGALAAGATGEQSYTEAMALHATLDAPLERARTLLCRGRSRIDRGEAASGRADLAEAATAFRASGAESWTALVETLLSESEGSGELAGDAALAPAQPTLISSLTPAELRVALAVGSGMSNKEVARQLFVSLKTVDFHLHAIYRKRNLRSRTELALALAAERALLHT